LPNLFIQHKGKSVGGVPTPPTDYNKLRFIQGSKLETQRSKSDGVLTGASASLPEMRRYSEKIIYAYGKSPSTEPLKMFLEPPRVIYLF
jgi:hypothetical protein